MTSLRALVLALALCGLADAVVTTLRLDALQARLEALPSTVCLPVAARHGRAALAGSGARPGGLEEYHRDDQAG